MDRKVCGRFKIFIIFFPTGSENMAKTNIAFQIFTPSHIPNMQMLYPKLNSYDTDSVCLYILHANGTWSHQRLGTQFLIQFGNKFIFTLSLPLFPCMWHCDKPRYTFIHYALPFALAWRPLLNDLFSMNVVCIFQPSTVIVIVPEIGPNEFDKLFVFELSHAFSRLNFHCSPPTYLLL